MGVSTKGASDGSERSTESQNPILAMLQWQPYVPLEGAHKGQVIPSVPGLYRIRRKGEKCLDYIGQTGSGSMNLRKRIAMLKGVYADADVMPYRDPHTAGPGLWALKDLHQCEFEVSVCPVDASAPFRKGLEAAAIALYRQRSLRPASPTVNFGRMPVGYKMSSANNKKLQDTGRVFRGGRTKEFQKSHQGGVGVAGPISHPVKSSSWFGHSWTDWTSAATALKHLKNEALGLYRIRKVRANGLVYIGKGRIKARLGEHLKKGTEPGHRQQGEFGPAKQVQISWVLKPGLLANQLEELEMDLIGAHMLMEKKQPSAQFLG